MKQMSKVFIRGKILIIFFYSMICYMCVYVKYLVFFLDADNNVKKYIVLK